MDRVSIFQAIILSFMAIQLKLVQSSNVSLDQVHDLDKSAWKIEGIPLYADHGQQLRRPPMNKYLPDDFDFVNVSTTKGIWGIFPLLHKSCDIFTTDSWNDWGSLTEDDDDNSASGEHHKPTPKPEPKVCDQSNSVSFKLKPSSKKIESVVLKYWFGGKNASIRISGESGKLVVLKSAKKQLNNWDIYTVEEFQGINLHLEAMVGGKGDYILIDSITVVTPDDKPTKPPTPSPVPSSSTTKKPTSSSTTTHPPSVKPEPAPVSDGLGISDLTPSKVVFFASILLGFPTFVVRL